MRSWHRNRRSKADVAVAMRLHEACCFSMMRTNVSGALMPMQKPPVDLSMSSHAPIGLPSVRHGGPSGLNFALEGKVTGRF